jgi:signal transduction histidine kinase
MMAGGWMPGAGAGAMGAGAALPKFLSRFRNRLLLLNLISLTVVIVISFAIIYFLLSAHMHQTDNSRIGSIPSDVIRNAMLSEMELEGVGAAGQDAGTDSVKGSAAGSRGKHDKGSLYNLNGDVDLPIDYGKCFVINIDPFGNASVFSRIEGMTDDDFVSAINSVLSNGGKSGQINLESEPWLFRLSMTPGGDSIVFLNVADTDAALMRLSISMIAVGLIVLALFFFVSRVFANRTMRPAAESFEKQRRFVADASHELKTPLTIIDANAEAALSGEQLDEQAAMFIGRIEEESGQMRELIDSLLYLARTEDANYGDSDSLPVDLSEATEEEIGRIETMLYESGIGLEYRKMPSGELLVKADAQHIGQAILILLDNAMKYTRPGGKVTVETGILGPLVRVGGIIGTNRFGRGAGRMGRRGAGKSGYGYITVSNTGEGIAETDLPHIFDRFYRADKSRHSSGYGLGLSIADTIVRRSGGQINAVSEGCVTSFTIELPLA